MVANVLNNFSPILFIKKNLFYKNERDLQNDFSTCLLSLFTRISKNLKQSNHKLHFLYKSSFDIFLSRQHQFSKVSKVFQKIMYIPYSLNRIMIRQIASHSRHQKISSTNSTNHYSQKKSVEQIKSLGTKLKFEKMWENQTHEKFIIFIHIKDGTASGKPSERHQNKFVVMLSLSLSLYKIFSPIFMQPRKKEIF